MNEYNLRLLMIGLGTIVFFISVAWVMSPTNFSIDLSMDNNTVQATENMANINTECEVKEEWTKSFFYNKESTDRKNIHIVCNSNGELFIEGFKT